MDLCVHISILMKSTQRNMAILLLALTVASTMREGLGIVISAQPPSGTVIANFEGARNATTLICNISNGVNQISTTWSLENYGRNIGLLDITSAPEPFIVSGDPIPSDPRFTFLNELTISNWTTDLDRTIVFCGTGQDQREAIFPFRVYRAPNLQDNFTVRLLENSQNVPVDLRQEPAAFPEPTLFSWSKDGRPLTGRSLTYSNVTFDSIRRADAGNYTVSATNFVLPGSPGTMQVGNDTGSFYLDVIYGPSLSLSSSHQYVLLGESLSLVCGTDLDSNPQATITWTAPNGAIIMDDINARYRLDNGPDIVRLNFTHTILSDAGMWMCDTRTVSNQYVVNDGSLVYTNATVIGVPIQHDIELIIVAPPGQPHRISVKESEATLFQVCWQAPLESDSPISYYLVRVCNLNSTVEVDKVTANTITNETFFNVTGLLPGTTYELTVVAVSQGGDVIARSRPSDPTIDTTGITVPEVICNAPVSSSGIITVSWSYVHTGGLPLTNVSVVYTYEVLNSMSSPIPIPVSSADTSVIIINLEAGFEYDFNITTSNSYGSSSTICGSISLDNTPILNIVAIAGGIIGGLFLLGIFATIITIIALMKRGNFKVISSSKTDLEVVYEDPDSIQQYKPKNDQDIELKKCPAYEKPNEPKHGIELEECPAYVEKKKVTSDIKLEECPAYVENRKDPSDIALEECPAYGVSKRTAP